MGSVPNQAFHIPNGTDLQNAEGELSTPWLEFFKRLLKRMESYEERMAFYDSFIESYNTFTENLYPFDFERVFELLNNQPTSPGIDLDGIKFDENEMILARIDFHILRLTNVQALQAFGYMYIFYNVDAGEWGSAKADPWWIGDEHGTHPCGVNFGVKSDGQMVYATTNIAETHLTFDLSLRITKMFGQEFSWDPPPPPPPPPSGGFPR
jgi:hypothetical protein